MGDFSAIPTRWAGVQFRSRLEAKWAAVFSFLDWRWEYEPIDLLGYLPDFVLPFHLPLLVEVKPAMSLFEMRQYTRKIDESGWANEAVIVGACLFPANTSYCPPIGLMREMVATPDGPAPSWGNCLIHKCVSCGKVSLHHEDGSWRCRATGCYDGNTFIGAPPDLIPIWREAANAVRWDPKTTPADLGRIWRNKQAAPHEPTRLGDILKDMENQ